MSKEGGVARNVLLTGVLDLVLNQLNTRRIHHREVCQIVVSVWSLRLRCRIRADRRRRSSGLTLNSSACTATSTRDVSMWLQIVCKKTKGTGRDLARRRFVYCLITPGIVGSGLGGTRENGTSRNLSISAAQYRCG